jgi:hypothetical protein
MGAKRALGDGIFSETRKRIALLTICRERGTDGARKGISGIRPANTGRLPAV